MCSEEELLNWNDADLDAVLFTADDLGSDFSDDVENADEANVVGDPDPPEVEGAPFMALTKPLYDCPVCDKSLKSASGFRGHVLKQHPEVSRNSFKGKFTLFTYADAWGLIVGPEFLVSVTTKCSELDE